MPWYSQGQVAVTANSATVTGTGTAFSANARVGDAFRGPDGRWYEITNIASATVLSIRPNYQGTAATGQTYAIAPMQGYVKESADRLRQLVDQYGSQLAALQPWATSATPAAARESLQLVKQTSPTDTTAGALMAVGAFGLGRQLDLRNTVFEVGPPADVFGRGMVTGFARGGPDGLAIPAIPGSNVYGILTAYGHWADASGVAGAAWREFRTGGSLSRVFHQCQTGGAWSQWREVFYTANILGPVSQAGGVPTGAIIERGSNANGEYVRFADGTQICSRSVSFPGDGPRETYVEYAWPAVFADTKYTVELNPDAYGYLVTNIKPSAKSGQAISKTLSTNSSSITVSIGGGFEANVTATGRWY